jgi:hypothetical protein
VTYEIRIRGGLGRTMRAAFPALRAQAQGEDTLLTGTLPDQAALHGVLAQIESLGLELLEVRRLPSETPPGGMLSAEMLSIGRRTPGRLPRGCRGDESP